MRRPGSAAQAIFSVFGSNGGKREATAKCESRVRGGVKKKKKNHEKTPVPLCTPRQRNHEKLFENID